MDVREKLVELLAPTSLNFEKAVYLSDYLVKNGVTVQELDGCEHCRDVSYTENPFTVITQMGREVKTQFNFCLMCGRKLPQPPKGE